MQLLKHSFRPRAVALLALATLGVAACSDEPLTTGRPAANAVPLKLEVSSLRAPVGERVAVSVTLDAAPGAVGGIQGALSFDPSQLRYVGQSPEGSSITIVNAQRSETGELRFASFNPASVSGRVALFVFETRGTHYSDALSYQHQVAATAGVSPKRVDVRVGRTVSQDASLPVPADARQLSVADWGAIVNPGAERAPIALRPGEYRLNLVYGDVDFDGAVGLFDYLGVANAAVGNDQIIIGTDGANDVDLVISGNVFPSGAAGACGTEADGSRVLDLFDYLAIANEAVGVAEACVGDLIPGRGPLSATVQSITTTSTPALIIGAGQTVTLTKDRIWQLEGIMRVQDGGVLNIEAGTRVVGNTAALETQALFVERGGRINAIGTQNEPIVFSCTAVPKFKGCWGGIFIAGRDSVNVADAINGVSPDGCNQRAGEGNAPVFGGCNGADNSGTIAYAIIEYGGRVVGANNELNGLTLGGVGRGTTIHHVQIHAGTDDGIEFFGGSVNVKYLVLTGNDDDAFDVSFGYRGDAQFIVAQSDAGNATGTPDSKAIEADGNEPAPGIIALPRTAPRLFNFTIIGNLAVTQPAAIHLRRATGVQINNFLVAGYPIGLDIDDPLTCDPWSTGGISILSTTFIDVANLGNDDSSDPTGGVCPAGSTTEAEEAFFNAQASNRTRIGIANVLLDAQNTDLPDWRMRLVGALPAEGGVVTPPANGFFSAVNYRGAVAPAGTSGDIPWYSGWTRGFQGPTTP